MSIFKDYKKYLDFSCDKAGKVYVNLCGEEADFYHFIPLNEYADCNITNIGLIYSYDNRLTNDIFGKGIRLSLYKKLEYVSSSLIRIHNGDFSIDMYNYDSSSSRFINTETSTYIKYENNKYRLYDKYDNYYEYNSNYLEYPYLYYNKKDNTSITLVGYDSNKLSYIRGLNSTTIDFTYTSNLVTNICIRRLLDEYDSGDDVTAQTILDVNITYNNGAIEEIEYEYYKDSSNTHTISMGFNANNTKYTVSDDISTKKIEVSILYGLVNSIRCGYSSALGYERYLYIDYETNYTRVYSSDSDTHNKRKIDNYYYYDSDNRLMYTYNKEGLAKYKKYNIEGKLIYESNIEYTDIDANDANAHLENLIQNGYFNNGTANYVISDSSLVNITSNTDFPNPLGYYMLNISGANSFYIYQDIDIKGQSGDIFTLNFWYSYGNYYSSSTNLPIMHVIFLNDNITVDESIINLKAVLRNRSPFFQSEEVRTDEAFNHIQVKLVFTSALSMYLNGLCLYRRGGARHFTYDENNNIINNTSNYSINDYKYDSNNEVKESLESDSNYNRINKENSIKTILGLSNTKEEQEEDIKNTINYKKAYYSDNSSYLKEEYTYYEHSVYQLDHNFLLSETDANNNIINYTYNFDSANLIFDKALHTPSTKVINNSTKEEYEYDYKQRINKIKVSNYNSSAQNKSLNIAYDSKHRLSYIKCPNNMKYEYEYGTYSSANNGNLTKIKYSNNGVDAVTLKEMSYYRDGNSKNTNLLNELTINGCTVKYEYDEYYKLENIKKNNVLKHHFDYYDREMGAPLESKYSYFYTNNTLSDTFKLSYKYDNRGRFKNKKFYKNNNLKENLDYLYEKDRMVARISNNGNNNIDDVNSTLLTYDDKTNMRGVNTEAVKYYFSNNNIYNCFFNDKRDGSSDLYRYANLLKNTSSGEAQISLNNGCSGTISKDGFIRYVSSPQLSYAVSTNVFTIHLYFKITSSNTSKYIFSIGKSSGTDFIGIRINASNQIELVSQFNNNEVVEECDASTVSQNIWHSIILSFNGNTKNYVFIVNNSIKTGLICSYSALDNNIHFGYRYANGAKSYYLYGRLSFISYENSFYSISDSVNLLSRKFFLDENVYHNLYFNQENKMYTSVDVTTEYLDYNEISNVNADFFPLTTTFKSVKGKDVLAYEYENSLILDRDPNFNYNKDAKRYCFESRGQIVKYDLEDIIGSSALNFANIYIDVYPSLLGVQQTLLQIQLSSSLCIKISLNETGYLVYDDGTNNDTSNVSLSLYNWYHLRMFYDASINYFRLFNSNTNVFTKNINLSNITSSILTIGFTETDNAFYGQYSNLEISAGIERISKICASKVLEYNELDLPISEQILYNNSVILSKFYTYEVLSTNRLSTRIGEEKIGNDIYTYYYTNNQITEIKKNNQSYKKYTYDYSGYLTREENYDLGYLYRYTYDNNGNRTSRFKQDFENHYLEELYYNYNSTYKDRLDYIDGDITYNITYSNNNPYYISYIAINDTDIYISYEGTNIISYTYNTDTYTFKYNESNERIEKRYNTNVYTNYYYDNHLLIREEIVNNSSIKNIYYLYDNNNSVYGFIYENERYYYIKDCMQNIIGIIDNLGIKLCDYKYDSYGNVSVMNYNSNIGNINSIRYKGYYYDKETGLYYCINRYYNPYLGRWLTIDNPKYIDRYNINSLNLFAYCENNPIMGYDPDGTIILAIIVTIIAATAAAMTVHDIVKIKELEAQTKKESPFNNVTIKNSYQIYTPWVRFAYSSYLNYVNDDAQNIIKGTTFGVEFEWGIHNVVYYGAKALQTAGINDLFGEPIENIIAQAQEVDIGESIFDDNHGSLSTAMFIGYAITNPIAALLDYLLYLKRKK